MDYGRTGPVYGFKNGQNLECIPQKKEISGNIKVRLISEKPTLPLNLPGKLNGKVVEPWDYLQSVTNLISDYGDVVFGELADVVGTEAATLSWCPPETSNSERLTKFAPVINRLETNFCDVPLSLLTDLVQESGEEEKVMETEKYYGNCLAHARLTLAQDSDIVLVYPGGPTMSELCFSHLESDHEEERGFSVRLSARTGTFSLPERICEVSMGNEIEQGGIIAVRTDHKCWFFGSGSSNGFEVSNY